MEHAAKGCPAGIWENRAGLDWVLRVHCPDDRLGQVTASTQSLWLPRACQPLGRGHCGCPWSQTQEASATELPLRSHPLPAACDYAEVPWGESGNQPGEGVCGPLGPGLASVAAAFNRRVLAWPALSLLSAPAALGIGMRPAQQVLAETSCWSEFFSLFTRRARSDGGRELRTQAVFQVPSYSSSGMGPAASFNPHPSCLLLVLRLHWAP